MSASHSADDGTERVAQTARDPAGLTPQSQRGQAIGHICLNTVLAVTFGLLYWKSQSLPSSMWEPLGAGSFPRLMLRGLICFNIVLIAIQVPVVMSSRKMAPGTVTRWLWQHRLAFAVIALFLAYVIGIHWLGFAWASLAFLLITQLVLGARTRRGVLIAVAIALAFSFGLDALFGHVFNILLPSGVLLG